MLSGFGPIKPCNSLDFLVTITSWFIQVTDKSNLAGRLSPWEFLTRVQIVFWPSMGHVLSAVPCYLMQPFLELFSVLIKNRGLLFQVIFSTMRDMMNKRFLMKWTRIYAWSAVTKMVIEDWPELVTGSITLLSGRTLAPLYLIDLVHIRSTVVFHWVWRSLLPKSLAGIRFLAHRHFSEKPRFYQGQHCFYSKSSWWVLGHDPEQHLEAKWPRYLQTSPIFPLAAQFSLPKT